MNTIFSIKDEFLALYEMATESIDDAGDDFERATAEKAFTDTLESLKGDLEVKASGYVAVMDRLKAEQDRAKQIKEKYKAIEENRKNAIKRMNDVLMVVMNDLGLKEMPAGDMTVKIKANGGVQPLKITGDVPDNMTKVVIEPDNTKIREYLKTQPDNKCEWAYLEERGKHIEVK